MCTGGLWDLEAELLMDNGLVEEGSVDAYG